MILTRRTRGAIAAPFLFALFCASMPAQTGNTITVRMLESRTGRLISTTDFLVQINHQQTQHADWVTLNDDGTGKLTLPPDATEISVHGKYESSISIYIDCDIEKGKGILEEQGLLETQAAPDRWYPVAQIMTSGIVTPNGCVTKKEAAKQKIVAKPGEFVFFVRKKNWREENSD
jgi:hypothetical protein